MEDLNRIRIDDLEDGTTGLNDENSANEDRTATVSTKRIITIVPMKSCCECSGIGFSITNLFINFFEMITKYPQKNQCYFDDENHLNLQHPIPQDEISSKNLVFWKKIPQRKCPCL